MKPAQAKAVLELLLNGIDPVTGECLDDDHVCAQPLVMRALHSAVDALERFDLPETPQKTAGRKERLPANRPWTKEDDDQIRSLYGIGYTIEQICEAVARRPRGLTQRMELLGLIEGRRRSFVPGMEHMGTPWYPEDDAKLKELFGKKVDADEIAKEMKRSRYAIACRLEKLGLIGNREEIGGKRG